ncbi:hypothetical protein M5K25_000506 [Dendrobium thyrsiflorum]|uniref:Uncharacterized protein n=1 Tax=Dendrobium thyrsiflorum TaxID=117978 RepID=A0ABD0VU56_DENTH
MKRKKVSTYSSSSLMIITILFFENRRKTSSMYFSQARGVDKDFAKRNVTSIGLLYMRISLLKLFISMDFSWKRILQIDEVLL